MEKGGRVTDHYSSMCPIGHIGTVTGSQKFPFNINKVRMLW